MATPRWTWDRKDFDSALRHAVLPLAAGVVVSMYSVIEAQGVSGLANLSLPQLGAMLWTAAKVSLITGVGRFVHRWATDLTAGTVEGGPQ